MINFLRTWRERQLEVFPSKYVLSYNGLPTNKRATFYIIGKYSKLANVHRIKTHALRHSHASLIISLGENALVIRDRLGHEDIQTTLGTYGHLYPNMNREVANKLKNVVTVRKNDTTKRKLISNQYIKRK
ncbi:tyrosine-type recombinase/integrase [Bacillus sp. FSL K6-0043]|uniref:tyrosine-type recombinase/integrase n=1 Tax=Bacillus sp. FSL K6-0043 TaxID=2921408 RepID=UPI0040469A4A